MADTAVMSPSAVPSRDRTEDVEMMDDVPTPTESKNELPTEATSNGAPERQRPKLNLSGLTDATGSRKSATGERRKGKSIFGVVLGTLNRAKIEDKQRMASEAAKKRQEIDARLQAKLAREQNIVRKQDESRKDQIAAKRKQEDLSIKDSILNHRASTLPQLANFLLTTDFIRKDVDMEGDDDLSNITILPKSSHPPALYYLPKILTPSQEAFLAKRRKLAERQVGEEKAEWDSERRKGLEEVRNLKEASESARAQATEALKSNGDENSTRETETVSGTIKGDASTTQPTGAPHDQDMSVAETAPSTSVADAEPVPMEGVDEDAVEY